MTHRVFVLTALLALAVPLSPAIAASPGAEDAVVGGGGQPNAQARGIIVRALRGVADGADYYWHKSDYPRNIALNRIVAVGVPQDVEAYIDAAWLLESGGDNEEAEALYQQAVSNNPTSSYAYYNLGCYYFNTLKNYGKAVDVFQHDVQLESADKVDWRMLAHSYEKLKDYDNADRIWMIAKRKWPNDPVVDVNLARVKRLRAAAQGQ